MVHHSLLASMAFDERSAVLQIVFSHLVQCSFPLYLLSISVFCFLVFDYDVSQCGFLRVYPIWSFLSDLNLYAYVREFFLELSILHWSIAI